MERKCILKRCPTWCRGKRRQEEGQRSRGVWRPTSCTRSRLWTPPVNKCWFEGEKCRKEKIIFIFHWWWRVFLSHLIEGNAAPGGLGQDLPLPLEVIHLTREQADMMISSFSSFNVFVTRYLCWGAISSGPECLYIYYRLFWRRPSNSNLILWQW